MTHTLLFLGIFYATFAVATTEPTLADSDRFPLKIGGHAELDFEYQGNVDLDEDVADDFSTLETEFQLEVTYEPNQNFQGYLQLELARKFKLKEESGNKDLSTTLEVEEAHLTWSVPDIGYAIRVGRQDFDDEREWLYDENLDGVRLFYSISDFEFEFSITREGLVDTDVLNKDDNDRIDNFHIYGRYHVTEDIELAAYWLLRRDQDQDGERPQFFGLRSFGEPLDGLEYWLDAAHVRGRDSSTDIRAFGADMGVTYTFDAPLTPYVTLAYAFGSGDRSSTEGTDESFRQTGLQDNDAKFGGVASFRYYGEVLDLELSNISIYTAGIGFRPTKKSSIDLVYHYYEQVNAADELRSSDLDVDPSGTSRQLGNAIDLVMAYREIPNLKLEFVLGYFVPGNAFGSDADNAFFSGFEARYVF